MFTHNTWDSSGVIPEGKAQGIYTRTGKCITYKHQLGVVWLACTTAGIQIIIALLIFTVFPFLPNWNTPPSNFWQRISHTVGCIPANKPSIAHDFCTPWLCCSPAWNTQSRKFWQRTSLPITGPTIMPGQSQVINWIAHDRVQRVGYRLNKFHGAIQISPVF